MPGHVVSVWCQNNSDRGCFFKEVCNLLKRLRYIFRDVSISGIACRGHVCPALNCWNLLCVFNLKRMQGRERPRGDLKRPRSLCRAARVVHDLCKLWRRAIKNDGGVFNQARGSPHLIPGSSRCLAKWLFLHSAVSLMALSFRASPLHVTAVSAGSRGVVSISNARIPMQILSLYADQSSPAQKVLFCRGRCDETIQRLWTRAKKGLPGRSEWRWKTLWS